MFQATRPCLSLERGVSRAHFGLFLTIITMLFAAATLRAQDAVTNSQTASQRQAAAPSVNINAMPAGGSTQTTTTAQMAAEEPAMVIQGDELPGAYGAPGAFSRSRFSPITNGYVLPPGEVFAALIYQGDIGEGKPDHHLSQEVEIGLPYRFGVAFENSIERFNGDTENSNFSIEGRWALADWGKIPLNPTLFAEYKFGTGKILHEEGPPPPEEEAEGDGPPDRPDAFEFRLLLSEEIAKNVQWAFNAFFEKENTGDRGREWGFAQSIQVPLFLPRERFKAGLEMKYQNFTVKDTRGSPIHRFVIGPSFAFKPSSRMRFDFAPLFGVTKDSPDVQVFAVFSYAFGGPGEREGEAPASTRNR